MPKKLREIIPDGECSLPDALKGTGGTQSKSVIALYLKMELWKYKLKQ